MSSTKLDKNLEVYIKVKCQAEDIELAKPVFGVKSLSRDQISIIVVIVDFICVLVFVLYIHVISHFVKNDGLGHQNLICASDFAIQIGNLPSLSEKLNLVTLKIKLWKHI